MSEDNPIPKLTKWPFVAGDLACVAAAVIFGARAGSAAAYFAVFVFLVAGAIILMVPYVRDFNARVRLRRLDLREEMEARHAMVLSIATDAQAASRGVLQLAEQMRASVERGEETAREFAERAAALEESLSAFGKVRAELAKALAQKDDARLADVSQELERARSLNEEKLDEMSERLDSLGEALESLEKKEGGTALPEDFAARCDREFKALAAAVAALSAQVGALEAKLARAGAPRAARASKRNLIEKAFANAHDNGEAVQRIIAGAPQADEGEDEPKEGGEATDTAADSQAAAEESAPAQDVSEEAVSLEPSASEEGDSPAQDAAPEAQAPEEPAAPEAQADEAPAESAEVETPAEPAAPEAQAPEEPAAPEPQEPAPSIPDLIVEPVDDGSAQDTERPFDEAAHIPEAESAPQDALSALVASVPVAKKASKKVRGRHAVIWVRALIGIGNKPYVRGEGGGLSPDKGAPMEFVEIGLWRWVAPEGESVRGLTVYKNDESPSSEPPRDLAAGEEIEISPSF